MVGLTGDDAPEWTGLDVGSPFDYPTQAILYVARRLPPPGRDGASPAAMDELAALVEAAGGRTLGLFSSMRAAEAAAASMRERLDVPLLCQGDDRTAALVSAFAADESDLPVRHAVAVAGRRRPGDACRLVVIDRIPFPRPDDPLMSARSQAVEDAGGNGFVTVSAAHAALRLAQGAGRLVRRSSATGVWSRSSTRGWPPPGTPASSGPRCRRSGSRPTTTWWSVRCSDSTRRSDGRDAGAGAVADRD